MCMKFFIFKKKKSACIVFRKKAIFEYGDMITERNLCVLVLCFREYVVDLDEGSQHLMRYRTIAPLVASGAVQLI